MIAFVSKQRQYIHCFSSCIIWSSSHSRPVSWNYWCIPARMRSNRHITTVINTVVPTAIARVYRDARCLADTYVFHFIHLRAFPDDIFPFLTCHFNMMLFQHDIAWKVFKTMWQIAIRQKCITRNINLHCVRIRSKIRGKHAHADTDSPSACSCAASTTKLWSLFIRCPTVAPLAIARPIG